MDDQKKRHKCTFEGCTADFLKPDRLKQHIRVHTGERPYVCEHADCGKSYTRAHHLNRHVARVHTARTYTPVLQCNQCDGTFMTQQKVREHIERVHAETRYTCMTCKCTFRKHRNLQEHACTGTERKAYKCKHDGCGKVFPHLSRLERHEKKHTPQSYDCPECDESGFRGWNMLRAHKKLAHPKCFVCAICNKNFRSKSNLRIHSAVHSQEREVFHCPAEHCPRYYYKESSLKHHISSSHEGKRFPCLFPDCGRELCSNQKLKEHMRLHDPAWHPKRKPPKKNRAPRKDKGIPKRCMAAKMAGVAIPYEKEKQDLQRWKVLVDEVSDSDTDKGAIAV